MSSCYIYVYEIDGIVRYIGRGRRNRIAHHSKAVRQRVEKKACGEVLRPHRFYDRLEEAFQNGAKIVARKIIEELTGDEAIVLEMQEIAKHPPGVLWNTILASTPRIKDADWIARQSAGAKRVMSDPKRRRYISEKMKAINADPAVRARKSASMKAAWADPVQRRQRAQAISKAFQAPEAQAKLSAARKADWENAELRARRSASVRAAQNKPEYRAKRSAWQKANLTGSAGIGAAWWAAEGRLDLLLRMRAAGETYPKIAERLGTTVGRAKSMAHRIRVKSKAALQ